MAYTISTHTGFVVARGHNIRDRRITDKEAHIDPNGVYEIWYDEPVRHAYHRLFDQAQDDYNAQQSRADRRIENYYATVSKNDKKHTAYEMIVAVGSRDNAVNPAVGKSVLHEFVDGWSSRNPNMELIGAYYHADEEGVPHVHVDYIPVAHGYKRGMKTQTGYAKALSEMGFAGRMGGANWWARENQVLEEICQSYNLEIVHPDRGNGVQHAQTVAYQITREAERDAQHIREAATDEKAAVDDVARKIYVAVGGVENFRSLKPEVLAETQETRSLFGRVNPATVTISRVDYNALCQIADVNVIVEAYNRAVQSLTSVSREMVASADELHMSRFRAHETVVDERVRVAEARVADVAHELVEVRRELADARSEVESLKRLYKEALLEVFQVLDLRNICPEFDALWNETAHLRELELAYDRDPDGCDYRLDDGTGYDKEHLLQEYLDECQQFGLNPNDEMYVDYERIQALKHDRDLGWSR